MLLPIGLVVVDPAVIIGFLQLRGRSFVHDHNRFRVRLQDRCRHHGSNRSLYHAGNRIRLFLTESHQQTLAALHNGSYSHGDDMMRHMFVFFEIRRIVFQGLFRKRLDACAGGQGRGGFVKTDVPVGADSQYLDIDAPGRLNSSFILPASRDVRG